MPSICGVEHFRDPDRPRRTHAGCTVCGGCAKGLTAHLASLPGLYEDLVLVHGTHRGGEQTRISGTSGSPLPITPEVADTRKNLKDTLMSWAVHAHREAASAVQLTDTVTSAAAWLSINVSWVTRQRWAPSLVTAVRRIHADAVRMLSPRGYQVFAIPGRDGCCVRIDEDGTACPGRLWVTMSGREDTGALITCDTCKHSYSPVQWMRLGKLVHARRTTAA